MTGMPEFATGVAAALGPGWDFEGGEWEGYGTVRHPDGRTLVFTASAWRMPKGRALIRGEFPGGWRPPRDSKGCSVTVGMGRPPVAVASDLRARLLPAYEALLPVARARVAQDEADKADRERVAAEIIAAAPGTELSRVQGRRNGITLIVPYAGWRQGIEVHDSCDGTSVTIELRGLSPEAAVAMLTALGKVAPLRRMPRKAVTVKPRVPELPVTVAAVPATPVALPAPQRKQPKPVRPAPFDMSGVRQLLAAVTNGKPAGTGQ